jgi:hypothetical protein
MRALGSSLVGAKPLRPGFTVATSRRIDQASGVISTSVDAGSPRAPPSSRA